MRSAVLAIIFATLGAPCFAGKRDDQVNQEKAELADGELWIYNDLEKGYAEARATGKPLLVVYRCIP